MALKKTPAKPLAKAEQPAKSKKTGPTYFASREPETSEFKIAGVRAQRAPNSDGRLYWVVQADKVDAFRVNHAVVTGRVNPCDTIPGRPD